MKVGKAKLVDLFVALGAKGSGAWSEERLVSKVANMAKMRTDDIVLSEKQDKLLAKLSAATAAGDAVELVAEAAADTPPDGPKKKAKADAADAPAKPPRVGVISTIVEMITAASENSPAGKDSILGELYRRFPEREQTGMQKTVNIQLPTRIRKERGLDIRKNEHGYWVEQGVGSKKSGKKSKDKAGKKD